MDVGYSHIRGNPDRGYGEHHRSWIWMRKLTHESNSLPQNSPKKNERNDGAKPVNADVQLFESSFEYSEGSSSADGTDFRTCVSCNPADVLHLEEISRKVFQHLPIRDLRACMCVCTGFRSFAFTEEKRRHVTFLLSRSKMSYPDAADFLGRICMSQYEEILCVPNLILLFKIRDLHPPGYRGDVYYRMATLLESDLEDAKKMFKSHLIKHHVIVGDTVISGSANTTKFGDDFCALLIPQIEGLLIRSLYQMNFDHAIRFGHFSWMQNCMDDIKPNDLTNVVNRGYLLITSSSILGIPEPLVFDFPFCGVTQSHESSSDHSLVFCGPKARIASVFLDHNLHHGKRDLILTEMEKVKPSLLKEDAVDIFAVCITNRTTLLNFLYLEEAAVFRQIFSKAKLSGVSTTDPFFGNTASTVCVTSVEDRTIKASHEMAATNSSVSLFFIVAVHR